MNTQIGRASGMAACRWIAAALIGASQVICPAHDQPVHEEIAGSAALSSSGLADFLSGNSSAQYLPFTTLPQLSFDNTDVSGPHSPVDWIKLGAFHEDDEARFGDHFYTVRPGRTAGAAEPMTDWHESIITPGNTVNSYVWATQAGLSGPYIPFKRHDQENTENWPHARIYQYAALTSPAKDARDANMAHLMYALGHVLHLNEDLSQPDHVRNDEHFLPWHRWIENYGSETYRSQLNAFPIVQRGWPYWQSQGFSKLLDFWDRQKFVNNSSQALDADAEEQPGAKLGLAEFSNGNFLGEDAIYAEFFGTGNLHYFPFPSLKNTTQPQIKPGRLSATVIDTLTLENHKAGQVVYIRKVGAGTNITHHSALRYFAVKHSPKSDLPGMAIGLSIHDDNVLQEYHEAIIPKAIEYSAGILDYFFRGKLDLCCIAPSSAPGKYNIQVRNVSGTNFHGGNFHLFYDDMSGVRTEIISPDFTTTYTSSLDDNGTITAEFKPPAGVIATNYLIVYKGTIGFSGGAALDIVDSDIALAAKNLCLSDSFDPTPAELVDTTGFPVSLGQRTVTVGAAPVSWGTVGPGEFEFRYVSGHYLARQGDFVLPCVWHTGGQGWIATLGPALPDGMVNAIQGVGIKSAAGYLGGPASQGGCVCANPGDCYWADLQHAITIPAVGSTVDACFDDFTWMGVGQTIRLANPHGEDTAIFAVTQDASGNCYTDGTLVGKLVRLTFLSGTGAYGAGATIAGQTVFIPNTGFGPCGGNDCDPSLTASAVGNVESFSGVLGTFGTSGGPVTAQTSDKAPDYVLDSGSVTVELFQSGRFINDAQGKPLPDRVRIKDWDHVSPAFGACADCTAAPAGAALWDGTFPYTDSGNDLTYMPVPKSAFQPSGTFLSLRGKNLLMYDNIIGPSIYSFVSFYEGDSDLGIPGAWVLWLSCRDSTGQVTTLWAGEKMVGISPKGAYTRLSGLTPSAACDGLPSEVCVEAY